MLESKSLQLVTPFPRTPRRQQQPRRGSVAVVVPVLLALILISGSPLARPNPVLSLTTADCLTQLANRINPSYPGSFLVLPSRAVYTAWTWDPVSECWYLATYQGFAEGASESGDGETVYLFTDAMGGGPLCSPEFLAKAYKVLYHELLHFCCSPHAGGGAGSGPNPPANEGSPPDCNDLNYQMHTADGLCDEIARAAACCQDASDGSPGPGLGGGQGGTPPGEQEPFDEPGTVPCPGLLDDQGVPIPGLEKDKLKEYCEALLAEHQSMQDRYNNEVNAETAFNCACGSPPWTPGPSPSGNNCCPGFIPPSGGCAGSAAETYPNGEIIPDCSANCEDC